VHIITQQRRQDAEVKYNGTYRRDSARTTDFNMRVCDVKDKRRGLFASWVDEGWEVFVLTDLKEILKET
jgi:hypothetical protein